MRTTLLRARRAPRAAVLSCIFAALLLGVPATMAAAAGAPAGEPVASTATGTATRSAAPGAPGAPARPLRILPIGDSVTQGATGDYTWRFRLQVALRAQGVAFDFVGNRTAPVDPVTRQNTTYADSRFDPDHAGVWAMRAAAPSYDVRRLVETTQPDVVVLALGINDVLGGRHPRDVVADLRQIVADVQAAAPDARVVVLQLTQSWVPGASTTNRLLAAPQRHGRQAGSPVVVQPVGLPFQHGVDTYDRLHPNGVGEVKIAHQVHLGLHRLGLTPRPTTPTTFPAAGPPLRLTSVRTSAAHRTVGVQWTQPPGVTSVQVHYRDLTGRGGWATYPALVTDRRVVIGGLRKGHTYELVLNPGRGPARSASQFSSVVQVRAG